MQHTIRPIVIRRKVLQPHPYIFILFGFPQEIEVLLFYRDLVRRMRRAQRSWRYRSRGSSNRVSVSESPVNSLSFTDQTSFHFLRPSAAGTLTRLHSHLTIDGEALTLLIRKDSHAISLLFAPYVVKFIQLKERLKYLIFASYCDGNFADIKYHYFFSGHYMVVFDTIITKTLIISTFSM